jgi:hypothetical protein
MDNLINTFCKAEFLCYASEPNWIGVILIGGIIIYGSILMGVVITTVVRPGPY